MDLYSTGQCLTFFLGGTETISNSLAHLLLELALNQDIQEKLYQDLIDCYPEDHVSFDDVGKSKYLECVVNESLRKYPAINRIFRIALEDCDLGDFKVKKGQTVGVSLYNLHHDPEIYPEPDRFYPERFLDNKISSDFLYLFGGGE